MYLYLYSFVKVSAIFASSLWRCSMRKKRKGERTSSFCSGAIWLFLVSPPFIGRLMIKFWRIAFRVCSWSALPLTSSPPLLVFWTFRSVPPLAPFPLTKRLCHLQFTWKIFSEAFVETEPTLWEVQLCHQLFKLSSLLWTIVSWTKSFRFGVEEMILRAGHTSGYQLLSCERWVVRWSIIWNFCRCFSKATWSNGRWLS